MQVIQLHHPYEPNQIPNEEVVMVLGFFDGVQRPPKVMKQVKDC